MSFIADPTRLLTPLMKITSYKKIARGAGDKISSLILPFDAENFTGTFENKICTNKGVNSSSGNTQHQKAKDSTLDISFVLDDSTYASAVSFVLPAMLIPDSVDKLIKKLLKLTHSVNGKIHEPPFLILQPLNMPLVNSPGGGFRCQLTSLKVENKIVDLLGNRVKAVAKCSFKEVLSKKQRDANDKKTSPDLTHVLQVYDGDNLPYKSHDIYEDPSYYVALAEYNDLDSLRDLEVGTPLTFPPLER